MKRTRAIIEVAEEAKRGLRVAAISSLLLRGGLAEGSLWREQGLPWRQVVLALKLGARPQRVFVP